MPGVTIRPLRTVPDADWLRLRQALWPDCTGAEHDAQMADFVAAPERSGASRSSRPMSCWRTS